MTVLQYWGGLQKNEGREEEQSPLERERNKAGWKSWHVAKAVVQNRECWSENVSALQAYWRGET